MALIEVLAVVGAVMGPLGAGYALYIGRLRDRDKLEHDSARTADTSEIATLKLRVANCESDCKVAKDVAVTDRDKKEAAELRAAKLEGENASLLRENSELRAENHDLKDRLFGDRRAGTD